MTDDVARPADEPAPAAEQPAEHPSAAQQPAEPQQAGDQPSSSTDAAVGHGWRARRGGRRAARAAKAKEPKRKAPWWELPALVLLAIVVAIVVKTFVVQPFYIPSQSMERTLHGCPGCHGDRILVNKPIYDFRDPHPGDIVVFDAPTGWDDEAITRPPSNPFVRVVRGFGQLVGFVPPDGQVLVKRVIAVGGQTVKGDSAGHVLISPTGANGTFRTLHEPYVFIGRGGAPVAAFGPVTVPKGRLWVMGDHRNDSADSRYHCGPGGQGSGDGSACQTYATEATVPVADVIGKAFVIAWPPSRWRTLGTPPTFEAAGADGAGPGALFGTVPSASGVVLVAPVFLRRRRRRAARDR